MELPPAPPRVDLAAGVEGITLTLTPQHRPMRRLAVELVSLSLLAATIAGSITAAVLLGALLAAHFTGTAATVLAAVSVGVTFLTGLIVGGLIAVAADGLLERRLAPRPQTLRIDAHHIVLSDQRRVPLASVLFVEGARSVRLVLRGGERLPLFTDLEADTQRWLATLLRCILANRGCDGTPEDVPAVLRALRRHA